MIDPVADLAAAVRHQDWTARALCTRWDPGLWFPETGGHADAAVAVCRACPVRAECLAYALDLDAVGVWGGTSGAERRRMRRAAA